MGGRPALMEGSRAKTSLRSKSDVYICPASKELASTNTRVNDGATLLYRTSKYDYDACKLKLRCSPTCPAERSRAQEFLLAASVQNLRKLAKLIHCPRCNLLSTGETAHASLFVPPLTAHSPCQQETHAPQQMETAGWLQAGRQSPIGDIRFTKLLMRTPRGGVSGRTTSICLGIEARSDR